MKMELPIIQTVIRVGDIGPDNEDNAWGDYQKLIILSVRCLTEQNQNTIQSGATAYLAFGIRNDEQFMKQVSKEAAEKMMVAAFYTNAKSCQPRVIPCSAASTPNPSTRNPDTDSAA